MRAETVPLVTADEERGHLARRQQPIRQALQVRHRAGCKRMGGLQAGSAFEPTFLMASSEILGANRRRSLDRSTSA